MWISGALYSIVPTLQRGNAIGDAPASRNATLERQKLERGNDQKKSSEHLQKRMAFYAHDGCAFKYHLNAANFDVRIIAYTYSNGSIAWLEIYTEKMDK